MRFDGTDRPRGPASAQVYTALDLVHKRFHAIEILDNVTAIVVLLDPSITPGGQMCQGSKVIEDARRAIETIVFGTPIADMAGVDLPMMGVPNPTGGGDHTAGKEARPPSRAWHWYSLRTRRWFF